MGKVIQFTEQMRRRNASWNRGYSDAYQGFPAVKGSNDDYKAGFQMGKDDREEDDEAMRSGEFDLLSEEERKAVYGDETDRV